MRLLRGARGCGSVPPHVREHRPMHGQVAATVQPSNIIPPDEQLAPLRLMRTVVRNPLEPWPKPVNEQAQDRSRFMGRETVFGMGRDLVRQVRRRCAERFSRCLGLPF